VGEPLAGGPPADDGPAGDPVPPGGPPRPWRLSARLLVLDPSDRLLLLRARDPVLPALGQWWEVPGGGVEDGEDTLDAALREVAEETGVHVPRTAVRTGTWSGETSYLWLGERHWTRQVVHVARLDGPPPPPAAHRWTPGEAVTFLEAAWVPRWQLGDIGLTFPDGVAEMLGRLLEGATERAAFRVWS